jgi:hypothetical protein
MSTNKSLLILTKNTRRKMIGIRRTLFSHKLRNTSKILTEKKFTTKNITKKKFQKNKLMLRKLAIKKDKSLLMSKSKCKKGKCT